MNAQKSDLLQHIVKMNAFFFFKDFEMQTKPNKYDWVLERNLVEHHRREAHCYVD